MPTVQQIMARVRRAVERAAAQGVARSQGGPPGASVPRETHVRRNTRRRSRPRSRGGAVYDAAEDAEILALKLDGLDAPEIARRTGRSAQAIRSRLCRLRKQEARQERGGSGI